MPDREGSLAAVFRRVARVSACGLAAAILASSSSSGNAWAQPPKPVARPQTVVPAETAVPLIASPANGLRPTPLIVNKPARRPGGVVPAVVFQTSPTQLRRVQPTSAQFPAPPEQPSASQASLSAPSIAEQQKEELVRVMAAAPPQSARPVTWTDHFQQRVGSVLPSSGDHPGGLEWWYDTPNGAADGQHTSARGHVGQFIADHTLPPYEVPDVDVYDTQSRVVTFGAVRTASATQEVAATADDSASASSRLNRDITSIQPTLSYALRGIEQSQLPDDFFEKMEKGTYVTEAAPATVLQWAPTNLYHYPLYFEDPALERYGHTYHPLVQPFASTGRFATQLVGLPYQMTLHPVHAKEYSLGWYRPGDYAPKKHYQIPFNEEATVVQVAVLAGLILIFP